MNDRRHNPTMQPTIGAQTCRQRRRIISCRLRLIVRVIRQAKQHLNRFKIEEG